MVDYIQRQAAVFKLSVFWPRTENTYSSGSMTKPFIYCQLKTDLPIADV